MELLKKALRPVKAVLWFCTTIVPTTTVRVTRVRGSSYMVELERSWMGRTKIVTIAAKEATVSKTVNLLDLL